MLEYRAVEAYRELCVTRLHSLYYFPLAPGDPLEGEAHDFWELVYIDAGEAAILNGDRTYVLGQGELFLHAPNRYHQVRLMPGQTPNIFIISFTASSPSMGELENRSFSAQSEQRQLISRILAEGASLYGPLLDCHRDLAADRRAQASFGALQTIVNDLELLLIGLVRQCQSSGPASSAPCAVTNDEERTDIVTNLKEYLRTHLREPVSFQDCCVYLGMSATTLKRLFGAYGEQGVMHWYQRMRLEEARRLLRSGRWNVNGVATAMGYSSCQMFSAQFKRLMGMSPTAYLKRVAIRPETLTNRAGNENHAGHEML